MRRPTLVTVCSLISIGLLSLHLTQDALREKPGTWPAQEGNLVAILILLVFLAGTVLLEGRRLGYASTLICGLFAAGMPVLHLTAPRFGTVPRPGQFLFMWTLIALGVIGLFTVMLSVRGLLRYKRIEKVE
jgi:hypothetical protein